MTKSKPSPKVTSSKSKSKIRSSSRNTKLIVKNKQTGKPLRECCILGCAVVSDTPHRLNGMAGTYEVKPNSVSDYVCRTHWNVDYNRFKRNKKKNTSKKPNPKLTKSKKKKGTSTRSAKRSYSPDVPSVRHRKSPNEFDSDLSRHKPVLKKHRKSILKSRSPSINSRLKNERFSKLSPSSKTPSPTSHMDYGYNLMSPTKQQEFFLFDRSVVTPWVQAFQNSEFSYPEQFSSPFNQNSNFIGGYASHQSSRSQPIDRATSHPRRTYYRTNDPSKSSVLRTSSTLGSRPNESKYHSKLDILNSNSSDQFYSSHFTRTTPQGTVDHSAQLSPVINQDSLHQQTPPESNAALQPASLQVPVNPLKRSPVPGYPIPSYPGNPLSIPFRLTSVLDRSALTNLSLLGHRLSRSQSPKFPVTDEYKYGPPTPPNAYAINSSARWSVKTPDKFPSPSPSSSSFHQYILCQVKDMVES